MSVGQITEHQDNCDFNEIVQFAPVLHVLSFLSCPVRLDSALWLHDTTPQRLVTFDIQTDRFSAMAALTWRTESQTRSRSSPASNRLAVSSRILFRPLPHTNQHDLSFTLCDVTGRISALLESGKPGWHWSLELAFMLRCGHSCSSVCE